MRRPDPRVEQEKAEAWNRICPVGTIVDGLLDNGSVLRTETIAPASVLGGHTAVAWLKDVRGCFKLDRCTAVREGGA